MQVWIELVTSVERKGTLQESVQLSHQLHHHQKKVWAYMYFLVDILT